MVQSANPMKRDLVLSALLTLFVAGSPVVAGAATLERIAEAKTFKIGVREDARPFSFKNEAGDATGYTVDLCREVAVDVKAKLGLEQLAVEFIAVGTEDRFQAIAEGKIDILCGSTTATLSRREKVSFSVPTFVTGVSALLRSDAPQFLREVLSGRTTAAPPRARLLQAFEDRTFGVRSGTTAEAWLEGSLTQLATNATMVGVASYEEGLEGVRKGDLDAFFGDRALLIGLVAETGKPADFEVAERFFTYEPYALAFQRGDEDFRLLVDRTLSRLYRSSTVIPIYSKYFGRPGKAVMALFTINSLPE